MFAQKTLSYRLIIDLNDKKNLDKVAKIADISLAAIAEVEEVEITNDSLPGIKLELEDDDSDDSPQVNVTGI